MAEYRDADYYEPRKPAFEQILDSLLNRLGHRATGVLGILAGPRVIVGCSSRASGREIERENSE